MDYSIRVACYERVSTEEQTKGLSIDAQAAALESWIRDHGHVMIGHYTDAGVSGGKPIDKRPAMWRLLQDIQAGLVDLVIFTKLDRWFRSLKNYYKAQEILDGFHCAWQAIDEDYETLTASGRFKVNIMLSVAQQERERTSERIKTVFDYKRAKGEFCSGQHAVPYGYLVQDNHLVIDPATEQIVRDVFARVLAGAHANGIYAEIKSKYPQFLSRASYQRMIYKPVYAGIMNGIPDSCPAYITMEQHQSLMALHCTRSPRRTERIYLFSGLIRCPECGGKLTMQSCKDRWLYYYCRRAKKDFTCKYMKHLREELIERALTAALFTPGEIVVDSVKPSQTAEKHVQTASEIERKMKRLAETYTDGLIDRDTYKAKLAALTEQLEAAREAPSRPSEPVSDRVREFLQGDVQTVYDRLEKREKRAFWLKVLHSFSLDKDYNIIELR